MPTDLLPSVAFQIKEVTLAFDRIERDPSGERLEREQLALLERLKYTVDQAIQAVRSEPNRYRYPAVRLKALRVLCRNGKQIPVSMVINAWKVPRSSYYMTDCVGGLITLTSEKEDVGDLVKYETFVQSFDPAAKEQYIDVIRRLATLTEEANRLTT